MGTIDGTSWSDVTIDGQPVQEITVDGSVAWTAKYTQKDYFTSNTLSNYSLEAVWKSGGTWSYSYNSSANRVDMYTGDNVGGAMILNNEEISNSGIFKINFRKTEDYPNDNSNRLRVKNSFGDVRNTSGISYYEVGFRGSSYDSQIRKIIDDTVVDSKNISYSFNDESSSHDFEIHYSPTKIQFYEDGNFIDELNTSNTTEINVISCEYSLDQCDGYLNEFTIS